MKRLIEKILGPFLSSHPSRSSPEPDWVEGGLYATRDDDGSYSALKILKLDGSGVHVRLYSNKYPSRPERIDESKLYMAGIEREPHEGLGMGHLPLSKKVFSSWGAVLVQKSTVEPEELEGYEIWLESEGGYF